MVVSKLTGLEQGALAVGSEMQSVRMPDDAPRAPHVRVLNFVIHSSIFLSAQWRITIQLQKVIFMC